MSYISEVADRLVARSMCSSIVGPEVYTMIADWEKKGIPLVVVLRSVEDISERGGTIEDLRELVGRNFRGWLQNSET